MVLFLFILILGCAQIYTMDDLDNLKLNVDSQRQSIDAAQFDEAEEELNNERLCQEFFSVDNKSANEVNEILPIYARYLEDEDAFNNLSLEQVCDIVKKCVENFVEKYSNYIDKKVFLDDSTLETINQIHSKLINKLRATQDSIAEQTHIFFMLNILKIIQTSMQAKKESMQNKKEIMQLKKEIGDLKKIVVQLPRSVEINQQFKQITTKLNRMPTRVQTKSMLTVCTLFFLLSYFIMKCVTEMPVYK